MADLEIDGDVNQIFDQLQLENARRDREQQELRQEAEVKALGDDDLSYQQYKRRRKAQILVEPKLPQDEMSYHDYCVAREHPVPPEAPDEPLLFFESESDGTSEWILGMKK